MADLAQSGHPLQSITEMSSLEDFVSNAVLAEREFLAERSNVTFVGESDAANATARRSTAATSAPAGALSPAAAGAHVAAKQLQIPRRPAWSDEMPAEELHRREKEAFLEWRREIARSELEHGGGVAGVAVPGKEAAVTPFEKNIEVWRQLWRVVERSDVLVQIVDARNPTMFRCPDLEAYVREVGPLKETLLVVNKADYLSPLQVRRGEDRVCVVVAAGEEGRGEGVCCCWSSYAGARG